MKSKVARHLNNFVLFAFACYLICIGIVFLVIIGDLINNPELNFFPSTREYRTWRKRIYWDIHDKDLVTDKAYVIMLHSSFIFMNHIKEILLVFIAGAFVPLQGLMVALIPSWAMDAVDGVSAAISSSQDEGVPPLEEDPAFVELRNEADVYVNGVRLGGSSIKIPPEPILPAPVVAAPSTEATTEAEVVSLSRQHSPSFDASSGPDQLVFDPVFGVVSRELRDRWRKQERDTRVALEEVETRRRQSLVPPVRYSSDDGTSQPSTDIIGASSSQMNALTTNETESPKVKIDADDLNNSLVGKKATPTSQKKTRGKR